MKAKRFDTVPYLFGETRVATLALLIFTALSGRCSGGVVITKFSGHAVTFRSSPTLVADTPMPASASTRILPGKPPRAMWSAGMFLGLYRIRVTSLFFRLLWTACRERPRDRRAAEQRDELAASQLINLHSVSASQRSD